LTQQLGQPEQVVEAEQGAPRGHDQERIWADDIGPASRQRPNAPTGTLAVEDPLLAPGVCVTDELELSPEQRMERMDDPESSPL